MTKHFLIHATRFAAVGALLTSTATFAQGGPASMQEHEPHAPTPTCCCSEAVRNTAAEVGPYAKYLIWRGVPKDEAIEAARAIDAGQAEAARAVRRRAPETSAR